MLVKGCELEKREIGADKKVLYDNGTCSKTTRGSFETIEDKLKKHDMITEDRDARRRKGVERVVGQVRGDSVILER